MSEVTRQMYNTVLRSAMSYSGRETKSQSGSLCVGVCMHVHMLAHGPVYVRSPLCVTLCICAHHVHHIF